MLQDHLGAGHEITSAEDMIHISIIKSDTKRCMLKVDESLGHLKYLYDSLKSTSDN